MFLLCFLFFKLIILFKGVDTTINTGPCSIILDFPKKTQEVNFCMEINPAQCLGEEGGEEKIIIKKKVKNYFLGAVR